MYRMFFAVPFIRNLVLSLFLALLDLYILDFMCPVSESVRFGQWFMYIMCGRSCFNMFIACEGIFVLVSVLCKPKLLFFMFVKL